jgi:hypothetical protein
MQLFCGHRIADALYNAMFAAKFIRCPKCGLEWRGWMVIGRDKTLPKKELREEQSRQREKEKSRKNR